MSTILLQDVKIYAYHGVLPEERIIGTYYLVDLELDVDLEKAAHSDELSDTLNYALAHQILLEEMAVPSNLLEHVADRILSSLGKAFDSLKAARITLTKTSPPMPGEMKGVGVRMQRRYQEPSL